MLTMKNVSKQFNNIAVLENINIDFKSGLNFIIGSSGSGKSTLLKLISGMDNEFQGEIIYRGNSIKELTPSKLNDYYYNSVGFIWQNFQLINHLSVEDNIKLVLDLSDLSSEEKDKRVESMMSNLAISKISKHKVSQLSGGQKQRVAIARALIKNSSMIIADEPTGALDKKSSQKIMSILKDISKDKLVIVVTHDKSLVDKDSPCFLLKHAKLYKINTVSENNSLDSSSKDKKPSKISTVTQNNSIGSLLKDEKLSQRSSGYNYQDESKEYTVEPRLSIKSAINQGLKNFKGLFLSFILTAIVLVFSSYFLLMNFNGNIVGEQEKIFQKLIDEKGSTLLDLTIPTESSSASGTTGNNDKKPNKNIKQDVSSIIEKYKEDTRIEYLVVSDVLSEMNISIEGLATSFKPLNSGSVPLIKEVIHGNMPDNNKREVAIPKIVVQKLKLKPKDIIGKKMSLKGTMFDHNSQKDIKVIADKVTIVGVVDTKYAEGVEFEDSFVYSMELCKEMRKQANKSTTNMMITMRARDLPGLIQIVDELNGSGIVPIGEFESVQDILRLKSKTSEQSGSVTTIISVLAIIITLSITIINTYIRKSEYAILKINGYSKRSIFNLTISEYLLISIVGVVIFISTSGIINNLSNKLFSMGIQGEKSLIVGVSIILGQGIIMAIIAWIISSNGKSIKNLKIGDK